MAVTTILPLMLPLYGEQSRCSATGCRVTGNVHLPGRYVSRSLFSTQWATRRFPKALAIYRHQTLHVEKP